MMDGSNNCNHPSGRQYDFTFHIALGTTLNYAVLTIGRYFKLFKDSDLRFRVPSIA